MIQRNATEDAMPSSSRFRKDWPMEGVCVESLEVRDVHQYMTSRLGEMRIVIRAGQPSEMSIEPWAEE